MSRRPVKQLCEFDRAFNGFGSAVAEKDARQIAAGFFSQLFRDEPAEHAAFHADEVGGVAIEQLLEDRFDLRMISPQREHAPAGEQIKIFVTGFIPQPAPFAADVFLVEPDGAEHLHERWVEMLRRAGHRRGRGAGRYKRESLRQLTQGLVGHPRVRSWDAILTAAKPTDCASVGFRSRRV